MIRPLALAIALALPSGAALAQASGGAEELTGLPGTAIVALHMGGDGSFLLYFIADAVPLYRRGPAAARLCAAIGRRPAEATVLRIDDPNPVPGMMKMVVRCR
ncbi:MAG: hypothetical protein N2422_12125 [Rhodobacteraceae bacterium]|nr:hypothetical protein [Paracoccaceae bacterium]